MFLPSKILEEKLRRMLSEDLGQGDITTALIVPRQSTAEAEVIAKEPGIVAGIEEVETLLKSLGLKAEVFVDDGEKIKVGQQLLKIYGNTRVILSAERTLLNILSHMSGIATTTKRLAEKLLKARLKTKVACTRKTAPGLLYFDKKAASIGGGDTHRLHLDDMILIKDNHIAVAGNIENAVKKARKEASFSKKIEVEIRKVEDSLAAAKVGADIIMFDNFSPKRIKTAVKMLKEAGFLGKVLLEASGGITSENILMFASTGVDVVSMGEITDSPRTLDINLKVTRIRKK